MGELDGSLALWGERSANGKHKVQEHDAETPYPFAATSRNLSDVLKYGSTDSKAAGRACKALFWIPTKSKNPIPSSKIIANLPESKVKARVRPWRISARKLSISEAVDLLHRVRGQKTIAPGIIIGTDLACWSDALSLASSMVARQQFLPGLAESDDKYGAVWDPVFTGRDAERLSALAGRMPAVGRALSGHTATDPPEGSMVVILRRILSGMTDLLVRTGTAKMDQVSIMRSRNADSIHDVWLDALRSGKKNVIKNASQLAAQIQEWQRPIAVASASPFRLCFRLEEPEEKDRWYVRHLLQPHDDPSTLVPLEDAWSGEVLALGQNQQKIKEFILLSLGQAAGVSPDIASTLEKSGLNGRSMDSAGAYRFLTVDATALKQAGYGVMLPSWWTGKGTTTRLTARAKIKNPKMKGYGGLGLSAMLQFNWEIAIGDQNITAAELRELARLKSPLVRVRGQWMEVGTDEIKTAINFLKNRKREATLQDLMMMRLGTGDLPEGMDIQVVAERGPVRDVLERLDGDTKLEEWGPQDGFEGVLRPYQSRGCSWLAFLQQWGLGGCLADDMGLGKTVQVLALLEKNREDGARKPVLLVCPTSVISNWQKEASRFTPRLAVMIHHGASRQEGAGFNRSIKKYDVIISSYGLVQRDLATLEKVEWGGVILDEAQNIKNSETKQSRAARSLRAKYRFALTGTPVENNVGDLWSIMEFLNPGLLGNQSEFRRNFFMPIQAERSIRAAERLKRITGPFILRRLKTDKSIISDLPEKMEMKVYCTLTTEQTSLYTSALDDFQERLFAAEGIERKGLILATLGKLKQICNHPAHFLKDNSSIPDRSGKIDRLTEMLSEIIETGERALVFSQFVEMGNMLKRHIQETFGIEVSFLHGGVSRKERDRMVEEFQSQDGGPQVFMVSLKAGGTGLNLTAANHVFHFDRWWNPAVEDQATDRAFRIGQKRNVQVHKFICAGTLEEKIDGMIERKKAIMKETVGAGEGWLTELSNDDLREVLSLGAEYGV